MPSNTEPTNWGRGEIQRLTSLSSNEKLFVVASIVFLVLMGLVSATKTFILVSQMYLTWYCYFVLFSIYNIFKDYPLTTGLNLTRFTNLSDNRRLRTDWL